MRPLSVPELLGVWEQGLDGGPVERALVLLSAACPESSRETLAALSIGHRDALLLTLREWTFGPQIAGLVACRACGETQELDFGVSDVRVGSGSEDPISPGLVAGTSVLISDCELEFRPPNSSDIAAISEAPGIVSKRELLFRRCIVAASHDGEPVAADRLPEEAIAAVAESLAATDPQADIQIQMACASCGRSSQAAFDIVSFFWDEIDAWAQQILRDVDTLASAYGWREQDILALNPARRQFYLQMVRQWETS